MLHNFVGYLHFWQHSYGWIRRILNVFCTKHGKGQNMEILLMLLKENCIVSLIIFGVFSELYDLIPLCHFLFLGRKKRVLVNTKSCISSTKLCRTSRLCPFSLFLLSLFFSETWVINTNLPLILFSLKNWKQRVMSRSQAFPLFAGCIQSGKPIDFHDQN